jgi:hypothetical protein
MPEREVPVHPEYDAEILRNVRDGCADGEAGTGEDSVSGDSDGWRDAMSMTAITRCGLVALYGLALVLLVAAWREWLMSWGGRP